MEGRGFAADKGRERPAGKAITGERGLFQRGDSGDILRPGRTDNDVHAASAAGVKGLKSSGVIVSRSRRSLAPASKSFRRFVRICLARA
jgi:hypothetical protein